jgi:tetratricopeptide (TPR) repeat protein
LAGLAAYANVFNNPFLFDDSTSIVTNTNIRQLWSRAAFNGPVQSAVAGRPIISFSLAVNHALGALNPWGYHAWNLVVHLLAGLVLFGILRRALSTARVPDVLRDRAAGLSFAAAIVWLVHPLNSEVVNYVTQRTESTMGLFYLLTLYSAIRAFNAQNARAAWSAAAVAACAFGMASKESMVTAPLIVWLYDAVFVSGSLERALREHPWLYTGLGATWILLAALVAPGPRWRSAGFESGVTPWTYLLNQPPIILDYLRLSVWPHPLVMDYGVAKPIALGAALPSFIAVSLLAVISGFLWFRWPGLAFLAGAFWITLAPSSSILPIATEVGAERRMYLPLMALVTCGVLGVDALRRRFDVKRGPAIAALAVVSAALVLATLQRNSEYASEQGIWRTVLDRHPHGRAYYNVGIALDEQGQIEGALDHWRRAVDDEPRAHYALGVRYERMDRNEDAVREYQAFLKRKPDDVQAPDAYVRLGASLGKLGRFDEASQTLEKAVSMRPGNPDARLELGNALLGNQRYVEAEAQYLEHLRLSPDNANALENLGLARIAQGREADAIPPLEKAVALRPEEGRTRLRLANALAATGRLDAAIAQYRQGIALVPSSPALHRNLAAALLQSGRPEEALKALEAAMALEPGDADTRQTYEDLKRALRAK